MSTASDTVSTFPASLQAAPQRRACRPRGGLHRAPSLRPAPGWPGGRRWPVGVRLRRSGGRPRRDVREGFRSAAGVSAFASARSSAARSARAAARREPAAWYSAVMSCSDWVSARTGAIRSSCESVAWSFALGSTSVSNASPGEPCWVCTRELSTKPPAATVARPTRSATRCTPSSPPPKLIAAPRC